MRARESASAPPGVCFGTLRALGLALFTAFIAVGCATPGSDSGTGLCPDAPAGVALDADGCPLYSDADAVPDYQDKCPGTAPGVPVDSNGCPLDTDADGVVELQDACPGTLAGARVDARGCPLAGERIAIVTNINFDFDRANVRESVKQRLSRVIELLREMPGIDVQIVGYTDDIGPAEYKRALSLRRAEAVRDYMVSRGIDSTRLSAAGHGESSPIVSNSTPEGRAVNRRVEFVVE